MRGRLSIRELVMVGVVENVNVGWAITDGVSCGPDADQINRTVRQGISVE